jgi:hypothetical protein
MKNKIDNAVRIPTSINGSFFRYWFEFLQPLHKLRPSEIKVIACFVKHRYELSKSISDKKLLDEITMGEDTKKKVINECGITKSHFNIIMTKLKKSKLVIDGKINPKFIPNISEDGNSLSLLLFFDLNEVTRNSL